MIAKPITFPGWLNLSINMDELDLVKQIPVRRYDPRTQTWGVPDTKRVRSFLGRCGVDLEGIQSNFKTPAMGLPRFKTAPRAHQTDDLNLMDGKHAFGILDEPGLGKTKVAIDDTTRWFDAGQITGVVVVCPNSIKSNWREEIATHSPLTNDVYLYRAEKSKIADIWSARGPQPGTLRWFVVAVESLSSKNALFAARNFAQRHRCLLVVDESTRIKTESANRTANVIALSKWCPIRRIMTGTMLTKNLEGAWSQMEILDPRILGMDFYPFRGYFCVMGGYKKKSVVAGKNEGDFFDILTPWVSLKKKKDCLDLPDKVFQKRIVAPSDELRKRYNDILSGVDPDPSFSVAMVRDLRLHQLSGGFTYRLDNTKAMEFLLREIKAIETGGEMPDPDELEKKYISEPIPGPNPKLEELVGITQEISDKMIVWCEYRAEIGAIAARLRSIYGDEAVVEFHGGIDEDQRTLNRQAFQNDPRVRWFVGQIRCGGIGLTLTAAPVEVFYSNNWSAENRIQAEDRIHRISQVGEACLYIDLLLGDDTTPTGGFIDSRVLRSVQAGKDYHAFVQDEIQARKNLLPIPVTEIF